MCPSDRLLLESEPPEAEPTTVKVLYFSVISYTYRDHLSMKKRTNHIYTYPDRDHPRKEQILLNEMTREKEKNKSYEEKRHEMILTSCAEPGWKKMAKV